MRDTQILRPLITQRFPSLIARVRIAADEPHAVRQVLEAAERGDLVVIVADDIERCHAEVQRFKERAEPLEVTTADIPNVEHYDEGIPEAARHAP